MTIAEYNSIDFFFSICVWFYRVSPSYPASGSGPSGSVRGRLTLMTWVSGYSSCAAGSSCGTPDLGAGTISDYHAAFGTLSPN